MISRHIDRILSNTHAEGNKLLSYNEHGLLLCEVYVLRELAIKCLPRHLHSEFIEEMEELANIHAGVTRQTRVVERVRWYVARPYSVLRGPRLIM